ATMPNSVLWAVDLFGRVYTLSTAGQYWELCKDAQLEFKRVSATTQCCWGIACDNQVYVYVCASDVPIRRREEAYENQVASLMVRVAEWVILLGYWLK
ncbi:Tectonin beta-propeller repeat-containing protein 1, partial [Saguinus oedipus]